MNYITIIIIAVVGIVIGYLLAHQNFLNKNLGGRARRRKEGLIFGQVIGVRHLLQLRFILFMVTEKLITKLNIWAY